MVGAGERGADIGPVYRHRQRIQGTGEPNDERRHRVKRGIVGERMASS